MSEKKPQTWVLSAEEMVKTQIAGRGIRDNAVLSVMKTLPRHFFVPAALQNKAYEDMPLPLGDQQTISQPYIVAYMSEALQLQRTDRVLEIGTGSGYQTVILAQLAAEVFSIELSKPHFEESSARLSSLGYSNITLRQGDGWAGQDMVVGVKKNGAFHLQKTIQVQFVPMLHKTRKE